MDTAGRLRFSIFILFASGTNPVRRCLRLARRSVVRTGVKVCAAFFTVIQRLSKSENIGWHSIATHIE
jgi:hypothetical protein